MNIFLSPLAELSELYANPLNFFENYISAFSTDVRKQVEETLGTPEEQKSKVYEFHKKNTLRSKTHAPEDDDVLFYDFPHHKLLTEAEYRAHAGKNLELHLNEFTEKYNHDLYLVTHIRPRYIKRYYRFMDRYITSLTDPKLQVSHEGYIKSRTDYIKIEGNIFSPFSLSNEKREQNILDETLQEMEKAWEKEQSILIHGLENMCFAYERMEQYMQLMSYFVSEKGSLIIEGKDDIFIEQASEERKTVTRTIQAIKAIHISVYSKFTPEALKEEHKRIKELLDGPNKKSA